MPDSTTPPIVVSENAGVIDGVQAAARYVGFLIGVVTALLAFVKTRDIAGAIEYVRSNLGQTISAVTGLIGLGLAAYGVFKTHKRGAQIATVASSERVPASIATTKP